MMDLLKFLDARLGEPSTYAGLAALLMAMNVNVDPGLWHQITLYGTVASGVLAALLSETGTQPPAQVALDALTSLATGMKAVSTATAAAALATEPPPAGSQKENAHA